ncbi:MAG: hypothetical protein EHM20_14835 [Alphaproteobacteria bacterium]|nr:MAG: hypothetical protein EHM20_14835 [Alphaproteobacteria bacterium]
MSKYFILLLIFLFQACVPFNQVPGPVQAEMKIYNEWLYAFELNDLKIDSRVITRPPGIEQLLFGLTLPTEGGLGLKTHCVYYQVPYKQIAGFLKIVEQKSKSGCPQTSGNGPWLNVLDIKDLAIKLENFKLSMSFKFKDQKIEWNFHLPNLHAGLEHGKYQPQREKKLYSGMTFLKVTEDSFDQVHNKYLGRLGDRVSRGSAIRCLQVDKSCQQVGENRCDECRYGWYQVVDYNCPQGGTRFCGQNHCGEKNEPACVRGRKVVEDEDLGICQNDLTAVFNADHVLICQ